MPLSAPPDAERLGEFPTVQLRGTTLYRLYRHRDPATGAVRSGFFFASAPGHPDAGGRYDLPAPRGTCYFAESKMGAWLETFRHALVVDRIELRSRRLLATRVPRSLRAADLVHERARAFGVTGEIHTTADYALTRQWAAALLGTGLRALRGRIRHDPALEHGSVTLLGEPPGEARPYGWQWREDVTAPDEDHELLAEAAAYGFIVAERPYDVRTLAPDG
jgi:hypothetical protein